MRDFRRFDILGALNEFAVTGGMVIKDESTLVGFLDSQRNKLRELVQNDIVVYGDHAQKMFAYVVATLGHCEIINEEDHGFFYTAGDITCPDYRILTTDGKQLLIEVKNHYDPGIPKPFRQKPSYIKKLLSYGRKLGIPVKFAIYISRMSLWLLLDVERFESSNSVIDIGKAITWNEMHLLGDRLIATIPPLVLRAHTDSRAPRRIENDGSVIFTIGNAEIWVGGNLIEDPFEQSLAWYFMLYGTFNEERCPAVIENEELVSFDIELTPPEMSGIMGRAGKDMAERKLASIGQLSQMASRHYTLATAPSGSISRLTPPWKPGEFILKIPSDYEGKALHLWRLELRPNYY